MEKMGSRIQGQAQACSRKGCMRGKGGPENATCTYKDVRQRTWGKWVVEIREPNHGSCVWLGTFSTSYDAAVTYDAVTRKIYGPNAMVNLPPLDEQQQLFHYQKLNLQPSSSSLGGGFPAFNWPILDSSSFSGADRKEYVSKSEILKNLNVSLPEVDDSHLWAEAAKDTSFQIFREEKGAETFPWFY